MLPKNNFENEDAKDFELYLMERNDIARYLLTRGNDLCIFMN